MTELSTEPVAHPAPDPIPEAAPQTDGSQTEPQVDHTEGGWPVVPLALSGANTTVSMVAAAGLAGGPVAAIVAATGAAVLGTVATYRSHNPRPKQAARRTAARTAGRTAARAGAGRLNTAGGSRGSGRGRSGGAGRIPGQKRGAPGAGRGAGQGQGPASLNKAAGLKNNRGGTSGLLGKSSQVKALRQAQKEAGGSRGNKRAEKTAARRAVADARRNTKSPKSPKSLGKGAGGASRGGLGKGKGSKAGHGLAGRLLGSAGRKARAVRDAAIAKHRARRDAKTGKTVAGQRGNVRKAPARQAARRALRRSAARFHGRRLLAALLALPMGLLGLITSPIGRKLNIPWLIHPGRRLYRRIVGAARQQRAERDEAIRDQLAEQEAAADAEADQDGSEGIANNVLRPAGPVPTSTNTTVSEGENVSGFRFEEAASEMEQAANAYDPENAMEILAMVEGLPAALTSVANVMKILAERSDSEFPLEKEVAAGFNDIFGALMSAVAVAEDMGPLFRNVHAQDIARHEDPRNGPQAEKGWNV
ncbi:hypothetical protein ACGF0K_06960 [Streptomyces sp. NPDC048156]|uniref:hypothetical protein n=1 Tax=Streptomyces sp. NPDC048156 TaxID=3365502 RepID=UPI003720D033